MPKILQFGCEIFTLSPVFCLTRDFRKVASDLFYAGTILVELVAMVTPDNQGNQK